MITVNTRRHLVAKHLIDARSPLFEKVGKAVAEVADADDEVAADLLVVASREESEEELRFTKRPSPTLRFSSQNMRLMHMNLQKLRSATCCSCLP